MVKLVSGLAESRFSKAYEVVFTDSMSLMPDRSRRQGSNQTGCKGKSDFSMPREGFALNQRTIRIDTDLIESREEAGSPELWVFRMDQKIQTPKSFGLWIKARESPVKCQIRIIS